MATVFPLADRPPLFNYFPPDSNEPVAVLLVEPGQAEVPTMGGADSFE